jgi:methionyl-tRNA formyltransferase
MQMDEGLDTGDILLRKAIIPEPDETSGSLFPKIAELGGQALMDTLDMLAEGGLALIHQDHSQATHAPMLSKQDGLIDWNQPAKKLHSLIRGLDPWPRAFCMHGNSKLQLFKPEVVFDTSTLLPGTVIRADREGLLISTTKFCLLVKEVQLEGKKRMTVEAFLNGHKLTPGNYLAGK